MTLRALRSPLFLAPLLFAAACCPLNQQVARDLNDSWELLAPYARAGIEADDIEAESKAIRLRTLEAHGALLRELLESTRTPPGPTADATRSPH